MQKTRARVLFNKSARIYSATADTFLTARMREAGLNLIGRTTTPEFGVCSSAENPAVYVTRNPWNLERTPGGSSGGSAAECGPVFLDSLASCSLIS